MNTLEAAEGLLGKSGVASWLAKARLTSISAQVYKNLGMDPRPCFQRREYKPKVVVCVGKGTVRVSYTTKTKGFRALSDLVTWEDLDAAITLAIAEGKYGFYRCRATRCFKKGPSRCPYCAKTEEERGWI
jgi:hypothetical protein